MPPFQNVLFFNVCLKKSQVSPRLANEMAFMYAKEINKESHWEIRYRYSSVLRMIGEKEFQMHLLLWQSQSSALSPQLVKAPQSKNIKSFSGYSLCLSP